jgi:outer membrane protein OmpA-like peptidoglycan-associated protein
MSIRNYLIKSSLVLCLAFVACQTGYQPTAQDKGTAAGGILGAGLGAIVGNQTGDPGAGVAIGAAVGALTGNLIGRKVDHQHAALDEQDARLQMQNRQIEENQRIIDELKRRGADVRTTDRGVVVNLPDVLFQFDSARLTSDAVRAAAEIAEVANQYRERRIAVEGHTDSLGTVAYNQRLSEERARSVAYELTNRGLDRSRISIIGHGEIDPIASNETEHGRSRNRRVEVILENPQTYSR